MIKGIGLDIVELPRIKQIIERTPRFVNRILTERERAIYEQLAPHRKLEFLGGRFAAKEAYAKALGTGIGGECELQDIAILPNELGAPKLYFKNELTNDFISITHTEQYAAAQVIILV
ncbi:4'-phosphopantetheinyl transferase [Lysinibacillus sp. BF-4]|uniref:holo-ACP synthase n=1 Tax=Lysinibacillus sp. BF-4 TaxID=1473546 RepID=UPI0005000F7F|nr:holo-ACP synthase [Lysinibacillus sp. BF-4]KFL42749.1 4'-phosphopantetheinyl transferase [Lysinibacillus sp. BF-4]